MASAEQRLLAAMLREPGYITRCRAQLRPEQFLQPQQKELYEAMLPCQEQGWRSASPPCAPLSARRL